MKIYFCERQRGEVAEVLIGADALAVVILGLFVLRQLSKKSHDKCFNCWCCVSGEFDGINRPTQLRNILLPSDYYQLHLVPPHVTDNVNLLLWIGCSIRIIALSYGIG